MRDLLRRRLCVLLTGIVAPVQLFIAGIASAQIPTLSAEVVAIVPHSDKVLAVAFSSDGARFATGSSDYSIKLWDLRVGRLLRTFEGRFEGHSKYANVVNALAFSPDGARLVSGSGDGSVRIWEVISGALLRTIDPPLPGAVILSVAFSPDGSAIVSGGTDRTARLWDAETGKLLQSLAGHAGAVQAVAFAPKGATVASGSSDRTVKLWDVASGKLLQTLSGHGQQVTSLAFTPDGTRILSGSYDGTAKIWEAATGKLVRSIDARPNRLKAVAFTSDGNSILAAGSPSTGAMAPMRAWATETGKPLRTFGDGSSPINALAISSQGQLVTASGSEFTLWDIQTGTPLPENRFTSAINEVILSPDGRRIVAASSDKTIKVWSMEKGELLRTLEGHTEKVLSVATSRDRGVVVSGSLDRTVRVWDVETGRLLNTLSEHTDSVSQVAITADGTRALSGGVDKKLVAWDLTTGRILRSIDTGAPVSTVALSQDGTRALSGGPNNTAKLWDLGSGQLIRTFEGHAGRVAIVAFSRDGTRVLTGSVDRSMRLWDTATGQVVRIFTGHSGTVQSVAFSNDGNLIVSGSRDQRVKIWDARTGQFLRDLEGHTGQVASAVFAPEDDRIVSASTDGTIRVWRASDGEALAGLVADSTGRWLTFTPAGFFAASRDGDAMISVVRGLESYAMSEVYEQLYRPDLVEERLKGDPLAIYKNAVFKLNLNDILDSGAAPQIEQVTAKSDTAGDSVKITIRIVDTGGGISKKLVWRVNGKTSGNVEPVELKNMASPSAGNSAVVSQVFHVDPSQESNSIDVRAYNGRGLIAAELNVPLSSFGAGSTGRSHMHVLAIGVDKYRMDAYRLNYAVKDAKEFAAAMKIVGEGLFTGVQTTVLTDEDVSEARIASAIDRIAADAKPTDVFVLFLSGHGKSIEGKYHYLPQTLDFKGHSLVEGSIGQDKWQAWLAKIDAQKTLLIFDTCDSGSAGSIIRGLESSRQTAMEQLQYATGQNLIAASREAAQEGFKDHGVLTYALLETLNLADPGPEDAVNVLQLAQNAGRLVPQITQQLSGVPQIPFLKLGSDFPIGLRRKILSPATGEVPSDPTHVLIRNVILRERPAAEAPGSRELNRGFRVRLIEMPDDTWALVARDGQPLGYVPADALVKPF